MTTLSRCYPYPCHALSVRVFFSHFKPEARFERRVFQFELSDLVGEAAIVVVKGCCFFIPIIDGGRDILHHQDLAGNLRFNRVSVSINQLVWLTSSLNLLLKSSMVSDPCLMCLNSYKASCFLLVSLNAL